MKSFIRTKIINGIEYEYEITPYYDPKTKNTKQRSKYLGKKVGDKTIKVREKKPKDVLNYGELLPLIKILDSYKIEEFLKSELDLSRARQIIVLSVCKTLSSLSLSDTQIWYESSYLNNEYGKLALSSQTISRLLSDIGKSKLGEKLSAHLIKLLKSKRTLYYDLTSISSYSELISLLEWGYCRDVKDLPQVNFSAIVDKDDGIPIAYELYPGSLRDVSTLCNTLKRLKKNKFEEISLILDRGFYSNPNLLELCGSESQFIIAVPERYKAIKELTNDIAGEIGKIANGVLFEDEVIFYKGSHNQHRGKGVKRICIL